jgi:hypothetical protein
MAIRFEFKSNGQAISKQQRINPVFKERALNWLLAGGLCVAVTREGRHRAAEIFRDVK